MADDDEYSLEGESEELPEDEVSLEEDDEEEPAAEVESEEGNLALEMSKSEVGKKELRRLGNEVCDNAKRDFESTEGYREQLNEMMGLFQGKLERKWEPFKHAANGHVPIVLENLTRVVYRSFAELFGDGRRFLTVNPLGPAPELKARADAMTLHDNWQLREQVPDFFRQQDRGLLAYYGWGDVTFHSYRDEERGMNRHEVLTPDEFAVPFTHVSTMPDYSDCPRRTKVLRMYKHELQSMRGKWANIDRILDREADTEDDEEPSDKLARGTAERQEIELPEEPKDAPYKLFLQEGWFDLDGEKGKNADGEKTLRFCQLIVDSATYAVASLRIHEAVDATEQFIYDRKMMELERYTIAQAEHQARMLEIQTQQSQVMAEADGIESMIASGEILDPMQGSAMLAQAEEMRRGAQSMIVPPPPPRPLWMTQPGEVPTPPKKKPIHMFVHGVNIENMTGILGLGQGRILADYNKMANTSLNQFADAATLSNVWSLIVTDLVEFEGGNDNISFTPGKLNVVKNFAGDDLNKHIKEMKAAPANPQLLELVRLASTYGQATMQAPDVLSGNPGKSGETYRGQAARIEQAVKQISVPTRKYAHGPLAQVLRNNAKLNAIFLDEVQMVSLLDWRLGEFKELQISRKWYEEPYRFEYVSDMRFASEQQRIQEADALVTMAKAVPPLMGNMAFQHATAKGALEARGRYDLVQKLGDEPPTPKYFGMPSDPPPEVAAQMAQQQAAAAAQGGAKQGPAPASARRPAARAPRPPMPGGPA